MRKIKINCLTAKKNEKWPNWKFQNNQWILNYNILLLSIFLHELEIHNQDRFLKNKFTSLLDFFFFFFFCFLMNFLVQIA